MPDRDRKLFSCQPSAIMIATVQIIGPLDLIIAGHALEHQLTLVTGNLREFSMVPGLSVVDWTEITPGV